MAGVTNTAFPLEPEVVIAPGPSGLAPQKSDKSLDESDTACSCHTDTVAGMNNSGPDEVHALRQTPSASVDNFTTNDVFLSREDGAQACIHIPIDRTISAVVCPHPSGRTREASDQIVVGVNDWLTSWYGSRRHRKRSRKCCPRNSCLCSTITCCLRDCFRKQNRTSDFGSEDLLKLVKYKKTSTTSVRTASADFTNQGFSDASGGISSGKTPKSYESPVLAQYKVPTTMQKFAEIWASSKELEDELGASVTAAGFPSSEPEKYCSTPRQSDASRDPYFRERALSDHFESVLRTSPQGAKRHSKEAHRQGGHPSRNRGTDRALHQRHHRKLSKATGEEADNRFSKIPPSKPPRRQGHIAQVIGEQAHEGRVEKVKKKLQLNNSSRVDEFEMHEIPLDDHGENEPTNDRANVLVGNEPELLADDVLPEKECTDSPLPVDGMTIPWQLEKWATLEKESASPEREGRGPSLAYAFMRDPQCPADWGPAGLTVDELYIMAMRFSAVLTWKYGLKQWEVVANLLPPSPERVVVDLAIVLAGGIVLCLDPRPENHVTTKAYLQHVRRVLTTSLCQKVIACQDSLLFSSDFLDEAPYAPQSDREHELWPGLVDPDNSENAEREEEKVAGVQKNTDEERRDIEMTRKQKKKEVCIDEDGERGKEKNKAVDRQKMKEDGENRKKYSARVTEKTEKKPFAGERDKAREKRKGDRYQETYESTGAIEKKRYDSRGDGDKTRKKYSARFTEKTLNEPFARDKDEGGERKRGIYTKKYEITGAIEKKRYDSRGAVEKRIDKYKEEDRENKNTDRVDKKEKDGAGKGKGRKEKKKKDKKKKDEDNENDSQKDTGDGYKKKEDTRDREKEKYGTEENVNEQHSKGNIEEKEDGEEAVERRKDMERCDEEEEDNKGDGEKEEKMEMLLILGIKPRSEGFLVSLWTSCTETYVDPSITSGRPAAIFLHKDCEDKEILVYYQHEYLLQIGAQITKVLDLDRDMDVLFNPSLPGEPWAFPTAFLYSGVPTVTWDDMPYESGASGISSPGHGSWPWNLSSLGVNVAFIAGPVLNEFTDHFLQPLSLSSEEEDDVSGLKLPPEIRRPGQSKLLYMDDPWQVLDRVVVCGSPRELERGVQWLDTDSRKTLKVVLANTLFGLLTSRRVTSQRGQGQVQESVFNVGHPLSNWKISVTEPEEGKSNFTFTKGENTFQVGQLSAMSPHLICRPARYLHASGNIAGVDLDQYTRFDLVGYLDERGSIQVVGNVAEKVRVYRNESWLTADLGKVSCEMKYVGGVSQAAVLHVLERDIEGGTKDKLVAVFSLQKDCGQQPTAETFRNNLEMQVQANVLDEHLLPDDYCLMDTMRQILCHPTEPGVLAPVDETDMPDRACLVGPAWMWNTDKLQLVNLSPPVPPPPPPAPANVRSLRSLCSSCVVV